MDILKNLKTEPIAGSLAFRQMEREELSYEIKQDKHYSGLKKQGAQDSRAVTKVIRRLIVDVENEIGDWLNAAGENSTRAVQNGTIGHLLNSCGAAPGELALLTLRLALRSVQRNSPYGSACVALGGYVEEHLGWKNAAALPEHKLYLRAVSKSLKKSTSEHHSRAVARHVLRKRDVALDWDDALRAKVGMSLVEYMLQATAHFTVIKVGPPGHKQRKFLRMSKALYESLGAEHEATILLRPFHLPMCVKPLPWTDSADGGYLSQSIEMEVMKRARPPGLDDLAPMKSVYTALNKLQRTGWRINADIFFMMRRCWMRGEQVGKLPPQDDMPLPAQSWSQGTEPTPKALTEWKREAANVHEDNARLFSKRVAMHSKLAQAGMLCQDEEFFFVYTMDWRGRLYPCGGDLTPQADDAGRALLEFSAGKPIGDEGFYWLAVQLANTFGYDKVSNDKRVKWVLDNEQAIEGSALNPMLGNNNLWMQADKPWSFLAACMEWTAARVAGPGFITHLPVAQDGSANGLQHFAALMRDQASAEAVNLVPADVPADIYTRVADRVRTIMSHPEMGVEFWAEWHFWKAYSGDWRGLVKRPVMTVPYGVTMYGIRDQLVTEMVKRHGPDDWMPRCAFLAPLVFQAIGDVVSAASVCMGWLKDVASCAREVDDAIGWTTPAGLPVMQDYRKYGSDNLEVYVGGQRKQLRIAYETTRRDHRKASGGLSPNFIHSLDAAHLMATVVRTECTSLAMVHDSYATLACDVPRLGADLRAAFVELHSQPLLELFRNSLPTEFEAPPLPELGDFDLTNVLKAKYFFA